jgi:hypothetical protein
LAVPAGGVGDGLERGTRPRGFYFAELAGTANEGLPGAVGELLCHEGNVAITSSMTSAPWGRLASKTVRAGLQMTLSSGSQAA